MQAKILKIIVLIECWWLGIRALGSGDQIYRKYMMSDKHIKAMINMCATFEGIDRILKQAHCKTEYDKAKHLSRLFDIPFEYIEGDDVHEIYANMVQRVLKR